jgi:large subunit ribosomal protein L13
MSTATAAKPITRLANSAGKTTIAKCGHADQRWYVVDAAGKTLGRLASAVAMRLMGKHKPIYTTNVDTGDFIIVLNTDKVKASGRKMDQRTYEYYTYYAGGRKISTMKDMLARNPEKMFELAVRRMLPKTKLGEQMGSKLKCFRGDKHDHAAQRPEPLSL